MNAVLKAREPSPRYLAALEPPLFGQFDLIAQASNGVARLRELILSLAVQGKLVAQDVNDEPASTLLKSIRAEKARLIKEGKIRKDKQLAEITEEDKPFALPSSWEWVRLGQVIELVSGQHLVPSEYSDTLSRDIPYLTGPAEFGSLNPKPSRSTDIRRAVAIAGDILVTVKGSGVGKLNVVSHAEIAISRQLMAIRPIVVDNTFLFLALSALGESFQGKSIGIAIPGIGRDDVRDAVIALPPPAEQSRIVARVDELMALCDALEAKGKLEAEQHARLVGSLFESLANNESAHALAEKWRRIATHFDLLLDCPAAVDALEQTILQLAVCGLLVPQDPADEPASALLQKIRAEKDRLIATGELKRDKPLPPISDEEKPFELPEGWKWVRCGEYLQELCTGPFGSVIHKEDYVSNGIPLINPSHMIDGEIVADFDVSVPPKMALRLTAYRLSAGDIVLARRGEMGRFALVTENEDGWLCGTGSFFAKLHVECNRSYLALQLLDPRFRQHLLAQSVGSTMVNMNQRTLLETLVAIPPLAEQSRIVARVAELRALCAQLRERLVATVQTQSRLAAALIEKAVA